MATMDMDIDKTGDNPPSLIQSALSGAVPKTAGAHYISIPD